VDDQQLPVHKTDALLSPINLSEFDELKDETQEDLVLSVRDLVEVINFPQQEPQLIQ
jgi:hypothetical protein